jgi:RNA polymerase sigma-70 factor (ECF subfamily)
VSAVGKREDTPTSRDGAPRGTARGGDVTVQLIERARAGDRRALDELFERYIPLLRRWARGRLPKWARRGTDTQDLVQDVVVNTLRQLDTFDASREGALQAYLRQAILNRIRDELRRVTRRPANQPLVDRYQSADASPLDEAIGTETVDRYEQALAQLSPDEREAIIARVEFGYAYDQIAQIIGRPSADAARMAVRRALVHLAQLMNHAS